MDSDISEAEQNSTTERTKQIVTSIGDGIYALNKVVRAIAEDLKMGMDGIMAEVGLLSSSTLLLGGLLIGCLIFLLTSCRLWCNSCGRHESKCPCRKCQRNREAESSQHSYRSYDIEDLKEIENTSLLLR